MPIQIECNVREKSVNKMEIQRIIASLSMNHMIISFIEKKKQHEKIKHEISKNNITHIKLHIIDYVVKQ